MTVQVEVCSLYSSKVNQSTVNICVLAMSSDVSQHELDQQRHLLGTDAIIFVLSHTDSLSSQQV